ncbi:hypothetical protein H072_9431 [Dactylellina haptotyla CBS 200.50]|uniref:Uncharacterized protein n=1 Tax=Dactylellina haptotyla (strain CBS 200.50) TaxID=1284197 RepID=S8BCN9_DACHA|nr:hypothetical protein H072_9431 [Dactylellina haptotyla CBS 200.50]
MESIYTSHRGAEVVAEDITPIQNAYQLQDEVPDANPQALRQRNFVRILHTRNIFHGGLALAECQSDESFPDFYHRVHTAHGMQSGLLYLTTKWLYKIEVHTGGCVVLPLLPSREFPSYPAEVQYHTLDSRLTYYVNHGKRGRGLLPNLMDTYPACFQADPTIHSGERFPVIIVRRRVNITKLACVMTLAILILAVALGLCAGFATQKGEIGIAVAAGVLALVGIPSGVLAFVKNRR